MTDASKPFPNYFQGTLKELYSFLVENFSFPGNFILDMTDCQGKECLCDQSILYIVVHNHGSVIKGVVMICLCMFWCSEAIQCLLQLISLLFKLNYKLHHNWSH